MIYLLSDYDVKDDVIKLPVFEINYIPKDIDFLKYDGIIFTSKNGIFAIDSFNTDWKKIPAYAIAQKTANIIQQYGGIVQYIGKSAHGDEFAKELIQIAKNKKLLYLRAKKVVSNLVNILNSNGVTCDEVVIYETKCKRLKNQIFKKGSIFIFTSPSTIKCFFQNFEWDSSFGAIAIGKTTASFLPKDTNYKISPIQSIESCIKLAKNY